MIEVSLSEPRNGEPRRRWIRRAGLALTFWLTVFALLVPASVTTAALAGQPLSELWPQQAVTLLIQALTWWLLTPWIAWLTDRLPIEGARRWRNLTAHAVLGYATAVVATAASYAISDLLLPAPTIQRLGSPLTQYLVSVGVSALYLLFIYFTVIAILHAARYFERDRQRQRLLAQAQMQALKAQLNPHFLYNTLNAVSDYAYKDPAAAEALITRLCDLLRLSFAGGDAPTVTLADELAFARHYLEIQQLLLEDRLTVIWRVEPEVLDAEVPNFLLQPLVENALVHGITRRAAAGRLELGARRVDRMLQIWVTDDGPGFDAGGAERGHGIGLRNTRARLEQLYPGRARLELSNPPEGGARVELWLPFRPLRAAAVTFAGDSDASADSRRHAAGPAAHPTLPR